jgi:hypothetical protein
MTFTHLPSRPTHVARVCVVTFAVCLVTAVPLPAGGSAKDDDKDQKNAKRPTLVLKATPPFSFSPARIVVTAELRGGTDSEAELYCPDIEWEWGDGTKSQSSQNCEPFVPGESEITRRWTVSHTYTTAGRYQMYLRLKRSGKVVLAGSSKIEVRPGARDLGEFER